MWYAVVINTDAEKAFRIYSTREQVAFDRAGRKILPARSKTTCSRNMKGKKTYPFFAVRVTSTASGDITLSRAVSVNLAFYWT